MNSTHAKNFENSGAEINFLISLQNLITNIWNSTRDGHMTVEEQCGYPSERQIEFFNSELLKRGENWKFPFKRV